MFWFFFAFCAPHAAFSHFPPSSYSESFYLVLLLKSSVKFWPRLYCGDVFGCWRKRGSTCGSAVSRARQLQRSHSPADLQSEPATHRNQIPALRLSSSNNKSFPVFCVCVCAWLWASTSVGASEAIVSIYSRVSALRLLVCRWTRSKSL